MLSIRLVWSDNLIVSWMIDVCAVSRNDATDDDLHDTKTKSSIAILTYSHTIDLHRIGKKVIH